jgi:hypothetical protein
MPERYDPAKIAEDLSECRQRGLDWLDRKTTNQRPVPAVALGQLADDYVTATKLLVSGRTSQIKRLIRDSIDKMTSQDQTAEAELVRDLFFGESMDGPIKSPGELLRTARQRAGDTEARFRERRSNVMLSFAQILVTIVKSADDQTGEIANDVTDTHRQLVISGRVGDNEHFIHLLADAVNVTIIGITNEHLLPMLQKALYQKRAGGRPDAFWNSLRIVFLGNALLGAVNDEREDINDAQGALRRREQEAFWAYKSVGAYLKRTHPAQWALYKYSYVPALTGALLEFAGGKKVVHLLVRRPRHPAAEHLYIDLEDHADRFSAVFEDIVHTSASNYNVPVGLPNGDTFLCTALRLHSNVLKEASGEDGWLPMVLVIMFRRHGDQAEPILQLRTMANSARELNRLSHLGGHVLQEDCERPGHQWTAAQHSFGPADEIPARAAERLVVEVTGIDAVGRLRPETTGRYLYSDKEHLFFFIFTLELPEGSQFPRRAEMHTFSLAELVTIRESQVMRSVVQLCQLPTVSERGWLAAAEVLAANLILHDHKDIGDRLLGLTYRQVNERRVMATNISQLVAERSTPSWASADREVRLLGLAGWQHREFFKVLLPLYAQTGIPGAVGLLERLKADELKSTARRRLAELYQDENFMALMPMEL